MVAFGEMTTKQIKNIWMSFEFRAIHWVLWPAGFAMFLIDVGCCSFGFHSFDFIGDKRVCAWCGKEVKE